VEEWGASGQKSLDLLLGQLRGEVEELGLDTGGGLSSAQSWFQPGQDPDGRGGLVKDWDRSSLQQPLLCD
jgi:hypothetical protein